MKTSQANFQTLVNNNAIKPEIGDPLAFFPESLDTLGILAKTSGTPSPGFSTCVQLCVKPKHYLYKSIK
jgi:hypothetical protein